MEKVTYKPILFSGPMVRVILAGRKTVTRRLTGLKKQFDLPLMSVRPPYDPGDTLWVRESVDLLGIGYRYRADYDAEKGELPEDWCPLNHWHPSIYMPKEAARIFLRVKDVKLVRLSQIDDADAVREGVSSREAFAELWDSLRKPADRARYGWAADPLVWRIEFQRCEMPEDWPDVIGLTNTMRRICTLRGIGHR